MGLLNRIETIGPGKKTSAGVLNKVEALKKKSTENQLKDFKNKLEELVVGVYWKNQFFDLFCSHFKLNTAALLIFDKNEKTFVHWRSIGLDESSRRRLIVTKENLPDKRGSYPIEKWEDIAKCFSTRISADLKSFSLIPLCWENQCIGVLLLLNPPMQKDDLNHPEWESLQETINKKAFLSQGKISLGKIKKIDAETFLSEMNKSVEKENLTLISVKKTELIESIRQEKETDGFRLEQEITGAFKRLGGERSKVYLIKEYFVLVIPTSNALSKKLWLKQIGSVFYSLYPKSTLNLDKSLLIHHFNSQKDLSELTIFQ